MGHGWDEDLDSLQTEELERENSELRGDLLDAELAAAKLDRIQLAWSACRELVNEALEPWADADEEQHNQIDELTSALDGESGND
jgi:hypothetical protein